MEVCPASSPRSPGVVCYSRSRGSPPSPTLGSPDPHPPAAVDPGWVSESPPVPRSRPREGASPVVAARQSARISQSRILQDGRVPTIPELAARRAAARDLFPAAAPGAARSPALAPPAALRSALGLEVSRPCAGAGPPSVARCRPLPSAFGRSVRRESSVWSRDRDDLFSKSWSSWDVDDKEALRWAALEKLPTYDRAQTGVLAMPEGEIKEVNADKLGAQQRIASVGDDHESVLSKFKDFVHRDAPSLSFSPPLTCQTLDL
ncbi:hypothetical protein ZWY2020_028418 [Hordeum vulgare]|nr:hypothetical protein ZWY2020_028418 [Hordeum vulgare]